MTEPSDEHRERREATDRLLKLIGETGADTPVEGFLAAEVRRQREVITKVRAVHVPGRHGSCRNCQTRFQVYPCALPSALSGSRDD